MDTVVKKPTIELPSKSLMKFGVENEILESLGLSGHVLIGTAVAAAMAKKLEEKGVNLDYRTAVDASVLYHFSRQGADNAKMGSGTGTDTDFMNKNSHDDIDYAVEKAQVDNDIDSALIETIKAYRRNPHTRDSYFPDESLLTTEKTIDRTKTVGMITSW